MTSQPLQLRATEVDRDGIATHLAQVDLLLESVERLAQDVADIVGPLRITRFDCDHVAPWRQEHEATIAASVVLVEIASFEVSIVVEQVGRTVASGRALVVPDAQRSGTAIFSSTALSSLERMLAANT
jgi:hypothetical protein